MEHASRLFSVRTYALAFAVVLSPAFFQTAYSCDRGDTYLLQLEFEVAGQNRVVDFHPDTRSYDVSTGSSFAYLRTQTRAPDSTVTYQLLVGGTSIDAGTIGAGGGIRSLTVPDGLSTLKIAVRAVEGYVNWYDIHIDHVGSGIFPCTEEGILDALLNGGGPHYFDCQGPTTVTTQSPIVIHKDVILDGEDNLTVDGDGLHGVFGVNSGVTAKLVGMTVTGGGNYSAGAGILNNGTLTLERCLVSENHVDWSGGGIYNSGTLTLRSTTVSGNSTGITNSGGGIYNDGPSLTIIDSTIANNASRYGGGVYVRSGEMLVQNSTFWGNVAGTALPGSGGGIYSHADGRLTLVHSTLAENTAETEASALYFDSPVTSKNTIIDGSCAGTGILTSDGYNIESPASTCDFTQPTDRMSTAPWALLLQALQDNGGSTLTMMPRAGSVANDVIPPQDCLDLDGSPLAEDQRGIARPQGTLCDVGAVELNETIGSMWPAATPEEHGFDSDQLAGLVESIDLNDRPIDSLQIVRNGVLILDAYFYPYFGDPPHDVASVTKSVTSTVAGIAIEQGILTGVDQSVMPFFPEAPAVGGKEDIEVEHLLTMSSGLACGEGDIFPMMLSGDWVQYVLGRSMASAPGTTFRYCSPCAHLLSATITRASGQTADEIAQQYLFGPLGIVSANWPTDPQGNSRGGGDLQLHPHDMARIGHLFLNDGMWNGQSVVSSDWVAAATAPSALTSSYGYLWWRSSGGFEAVGRGGQGIVVRPADRLVVVLTGRGSAGSGEVMSTVLAAMSDGPLPPNAPAHDRLMTAIANATIPPPTQPVPALPDIAADVSGENYQVGLNQYGIECYSVLFHSPSDVELTVVLPDGSHTIPVGMDGVPRFSEEDIVGFPVGMVGAWETPTKFVAHYDQLGGSTYMRVESEFGSDVNTVETQMVDKTGYFGTQVVQGTRVATCP